MADRDAPKTTVVERGGNGGMILIGIALLIAVLAGTYFLVNQGRNDNARTDAVTQTADKIGDAAKDAAKK